jgi:hypothetical protein
MRVIVTVSEGSSPELYADLLRLPARQRAERLRNLSHMGMVHITRSSDIALPITENRSRLSDSETHSGRSNLLKQLKVTLGS